MTNWMHQGTVVTIFAFATNQLITAIEAVFNYLRELQFCIVKVPRHQKKITKNLSNDF